MNSVIFHIYKNNKKEYKKYKGYMLSYRIYLYDNGSKLFGTIFSTLTLLLLRNEYAK